MARARAHLLFAGIPTNEHSERVQDETARQEFQGLCSFPVLVSSIFISRPASTSPTPILIRHAEYD